MRPPSVAFPATRFLSCVAALLVAAEASSVAADPEPAGWKIAFHGSRSRPALTDGVLYVGSADGAMHAFDARTGAPRWRFDTGAGLPAGSAGFEVVAVPAESGLAGGIRAGLSAAKARSARGVRRVDDSPTVMGSTVFFAAGDFSFYALDAASGALRWSFDAKETIFRSVVAESVAYVVTASGLRALDAATGVLKWRFDTLVEFPLRQRRPPAGPVFGGGTLYLTAWPFLVADSVRHSHLYALDPADGTAKWKARVDGLDISAPLSAGGLVLVAAQPRAPGALYSESATVFAMDGGTGEVRWRSDTPIDVESGLLALAGRTVCWGTDRGLRALDLATGRTLWSFKGMVRSVATDDRSLYVVTSGGSMARPRDRVHAIELSDGRERWSRGVGGSAGAVAIQNGLVVTVGVPAVQATDAATGKARWSFECAKPAAAPLISDGTIFLPTASAILPGGQALGESFLYAIRVDSGRAGP